MLDLRIDRNGTPLVIKRWRVVGIKDGRMTEVYVKAVDHAHARVAAQSAPFEMTDIRSVALQ